MSRSRPTNERSLYIFGDESYGYPGRSVLTVSCIAFVQTEFSRYIPSLRKIAACGRKKKIERFGGFISAANTFIGISRTDMAKVCSDLDVQDPPYRDVGTIDRRDSIWAHALGYTLSLVMTHLVGRGWIFRIVDFYYDPKCLTALHLPVFKEGLASTISQNATSQRCESDPSFDGKVRLRRILAVEKRAPGEKTTRFQWGTWCAHTACEAARLRRKALWPSNVEERDLTEIMREVLHTAQT